jgi:uncharacterized membrane protein YraQ (UPF0718 family)
MRHPAADDDGGKTTMWEALADQLVYGLLGLEAGARMTRTLHFFVHEVAKIGILLVAVTHLMGLVNALLPVERVREIIASGRLRGGEHLAASSFGAVTPFCSCSSVPLFIGFLQGGIPLGVTFSFLITSPLVNEVALAVFLGSFGWKVMALYAGSGILLGTALGAILGRFDLERHVESWIRDATTCSEGGCDGRDASRPPWSAVMRRVSREAMDITRGVVPYVVAGVAVGAAVHGWVPDGMFDAWLGEGNPLAVPLAVVAAVPLYAGASGVIPIIESLVAKGIPLGTALAFMMGVVGLSLPEALMLKKVMRPRLLATFFGSVAACIVLVGYGFNVLF